MTQEQREAQMGNGLQASKALYGDTKLMSKIFNVQAKVGAISKEKENPYFKSSYFDINILLDKVLPIIQEEGLVLIQPVRDNRVYSILIDKETGEFEDSAIELPTGVKPQDLGSAITYYRRYTLQSLLSLQAEDDDGNTASGRNHKNGTPPKNKLAPVIDEKTGEKMWLGEDKPKHWKNAENKIRSGEREPNELRQAYKVSKANMAHFERLKEDRLAEIDAEFDASETPFT